MIQISLRVHTVWIESLQFALRNLKFLTIQRALSKNSDQTARMRRLMWVFARHMCKGIFSYVENHMMQTAGLRTMPALISLCICTGWSGPSLSAYRIYGYWSTCRRAENVHIRLHACARSIHIWHKGFFATLRITCRWTIGHYHNYPKYSPGHFNGTWFTW